jgi:hypothetical protein|uniref:Uncharacterized protein n=1 Tax=Podoviridae sp. ctz6O13 TaxID=2827757 RepID=A0A8S5TKG4_9CAUD|nr:MAG TPA: hypothetical protein [Podoviridae sp. ctz6O13]
MKVDTTLYKWTEFPLDTYESEWYNRKWVTETAFGLLSIYEHIAYGTQHITAYDIYMPERSKHGFLMGGGSATTLEQAKDEAQKSFNKFVEQKFAIHNKR